MRTIKFRGLRPDTGNFAYGFLMYRNSDGVYFIAPQESSESFIIDESTIGQFTGLHDKNGVEIYEGDELENHWVVGYNEDRFMCFAENAATRVSSIFTITGNIHQTTTP